MKTTFEGITISATLKAEGIEQQNQPKSSKITLRCNQFRVNLKYEGRRASFLFHGSHADWQKGETEMSEANLKFALYCFLSDADAGRQTFEDFCGDFGYDEDSRTAERIFKACQRFAVKQEKLNIPSDLEDKIREQLR